MYKPLSSLSVYSGGLIKMTDHNIIILGKVSHQLKVLRLTDPMTDEVVSSITKLEKVMMCLLDGNPTCILGNSRIDDTVNVTTGTNESIITPIIDNNTCKKTSVRSSKSKGRRDGDDPSIDYSMMRNTDKIIDSNIVNPAYTGHEKRVTKGIIMTKILTGIFFILVISKIVSHGLSLAVLT